MTLERVTKNYYTNKRKALIMFNLNTPFSGAAMNQPFHVNHTAILHVKDTAKCKRFFRVTSTSQRSVKEVLVKVAHSIANRAWEPIIGVTTMDVLTQSEEFQKAWKYNVEEITNKEECKWINDGGSIAADEEEYYCSEYLVKSLKVREQEVAAFIMGYISALICENAIRIPNDCYDLSYKDAERWAHKFLFLEDRYRYRAHLNSPKEWELPHLSMGDRYETSYMTVATWEEAPNVEYEVIALKMFIKEQII